MSSEQGFVSRICLKEFVACEITWKARVNAIGGWRCMMKEIGATVLRDFLE